MLACELRASVSMAVASGWALIFDLDGVVIDSMPLHTEAWKIYLERLGIAPVGIEERMHGRRNDEIVTHYFGPGLEPSDVLRHGAAKEQLFREMMGPQLHSHVVPGVVDFLSRAKGSPVGLASNADRVNIDFVLDGADLRERFDVIVDGHQVTRPKPFPDIYWRAAELLRTEPAHCIVFEDSPTGIEAARSAGMKVVAIQTHPAPLPEADLLIRDFHDGLLSGWLKNLQPVL